MTEETRIIDADFILRSKRLKLTALSEEDVRGLLPFFSEPSRFYFYLPETLHPYNLTQLQQFLNEWHDGQSYLAFAIKTMDERLIGLCNLDSIDRRNRQAEIGIALSEISAHGQGYAEEALRIMLRYAFGELDLRRVYCRYMEGNDASAKLFHALGFHIEGCLREAQRRGDRWLNMFILGLLRREFSENERKREG